jgi:hypothetical protein
MRAGKNPLTPMSAEQSLATGGSGVFASNSGNMLFYTASWRILQAEGADLVADGYAMEQRPAVGFARKINRDYDRVVIPLANAFRVSFLPQLARLTNVIRRLDVPVTVLGVGAQLNLDGDISKASPELRAGVRAFVDAVLDRSESIGVRGEFTRALLTDIGIDAGRIDVIGCPSLYGYGGAGELATRPAIDHDSPLAVTYSPYVADVGHFVKSVTSRYPNSFVVPQTVEALALMLWGEPTRFAAKTELPETVDHELYISDRMRFFVDATTWIDTLRDRHLVVGTRIHGTIAGLLAGAPSILVAHDSRTRELAEFHGIPFVRREQLKSADIASWYADADFPAFTSAHAGNIATFRSFLERNGLDHTLGQSRTPFDEEIARADLPAPVHTLFPSDAEGRRAILDRLAWLREGGATRGQRKTYPPSLTAVAKAVDRAAMTLHSAIRR